MTELWETLLTIPSTDDCIVRPHACMSGPRPYGQVQYDGKLWYVHRLVYVLHIGPIPEGHDVCHSCDNPPCFNPQHLFSGTRQDNMMDAANKGRMPKRKGEHAPYVILTEAQVREIRAIYRPHTRGLGHKSLAKRYGVSEGAVQNVILRRTWRHI
jgi:hypothetical protein